MITLKELIGSLDFNSLPERHRSNIMDLLQTVNKLRQAYGKPMIVTSGYRSEADHRRIYAEKGTPDSKIPWGSAHLSGLAMDVSDPNQVLQAWCLKNMHVLEQLGLYCEDFAYTKNWVHLQLRAPKSGKRFFKP